MISTRKIQLLAAAVIANGALALMMMSPQDAQAASCGSVTSCAPAIACTFGPQACAPISGCQVVSISCGAICNNWPISQAFVTCNYAPL